MAVGVALQLAQTQETATLCPCCNPQGVVSHWGLQLILGEGGSSSQDSLKGDEEGGAYSEEGGSFPNDSSRVRGPEEMLGAQAMLATGLAQGCKAVQWLGICFC